LGIEYRKDAPVDVPLLTELYRSSSLGARRPLDDPRIVQQMIEHSNLIVTAWDGALLVGLARSLTDFGYIAYLADLVVRESHQRQRVGLELIHRTQQALGPRAKLLLLAAPEAAEYYPHIGFSAISGAWIIGARDELGDRTGST
jgi:predicted N-acetyltransferase YhbS